MNSKNLLTKLSDLESSLGNFSFEELTSEEANRLQKSFQKFKVQLEEKVWGELPGTDAETHLAEGEPGLSDDLKALATACSQLRIPLSGIIGLAEMLEEGSLNEEQQYQVRSLQEAGENLMNMVVEVTEFSRLLAGFESFEQVNFNFHNLIEDVEYLCRTLIVDKRQELRVTLDQAIPRRLKGDPSKLSQILLHLLGISVKCEFDGNISFDVQFQHKEEEKIYLEFVISNQGTLGDMALQAATPLGNKVPGTAFQNNCLTGLGLPIVNQIVQSLGGEIYIQDAPGLSATYAFRLPFSVAGDHVAKVPGRKTQEIGEGLQILVIDKNELNQQTISRRCKSWGCTPYITDNTCDADRMLDNSIDLLLVDLPADAHEEIAFIERIRNNTSPDIKKLHVIGVIGKAAGDTSDSIHLNGIDDYLVKPYGAEELQRKLEQFGKRRKSFNKRVSVLNQAVGDRTQKNLIDLECVLQDCMGRMETLEELVALFKQKTLEFIGSVKLHLDRADFKGVEYACQKVASSLRLLSAKSLFDIVEQIHKSCGNNPDTKHLRFLHHCFIEEYPQVEEAVDQALNRLRRKK